LLNPTGSSRMGSFLMLDLDRQVETQVILIVLGVEMLHCTY
jgi:hypothetical protein